MKKLLPFLLITLLLAPLSAGVVRAAEPVSSEQPILTDAEIRLLALGNILKLTTEEIRGLRSRLESLDRPTDEEFALVYDTLMSDLKDHLGHVDLIQKDLESPFTTPSGVRAIADNLKKWRETVYDPGTREIFDLLVLIQGGSILSITEIRYEKVTSDVKKLKLTLEASKANALETLFGGATERLINARALNAKAREIFLATFRVSRPQLSYKFEKIVAKRAQALATQGLTASAVESVAPEGLVGEVKQKTVLDTLDFTKETVRTLMERMVKEIPEIYNVFLQMRALVHPE